MSDGRLLVAKLREAAARHSSSWAALVPSPCEVNLEAEAGEEEAYAEMVQAKCALRDHICRVYGISIEEFGSLAMP